MHRLASFLTSIIRVTGGRPLFCGSSLWALVAKAAFCRVLVATFVGSSPRSLRMLFREHFAAQPFSWTPWDSWPKLLAQKFSELFWRRETCLCQQIILNKDGTGDLNSRLIDESPTTPGTVHIVLLLISSNVARLLDGAAPLYCILRTPTVPGIQCSPNRKLRESSDWTIVFSWLSFCSSKWMEANFFVTFVSVRSVEFANARPTACHTVAVLLFHIFINKKMFLGKRLHDCTLKILVVTILDRLDSEAIARKRE